MNDFFSFKPGNLTKATTFEKIKYKKIHLHKIFYVIIFFVCLIATYYIFKNCIEQEDNLSSTISLGSIFATFGSSIVAIFSITCSSIYERFNRNISILFDDIVPDSKWTRWPFIKRITISKLHNNELTYQKLDNSVVSFNVGSHIINISLPTILEDFYDLPNRKSYYLMLFQTKNYETLVLKQSTNPAIALMVWDCIIDNFKAIEIYKFSRLMIVIGESLIISSILLAFTYSRIPF